ncbi:MAG: M23 family metallopeptidase [Lachnospiraceae bacterium]|nr:M23 family metallopeptidase [Lachnospiraceae bacterium]
MKPRKHKRKESFSVLLISNTGHNSKQYHITKSCMRLVAVFVCLVCITFGWFTYRYLTGQENISIAAGDNKDEEQTELMMQLASQQEAIKQLEEEKADLANQNNALTSENRALLEAAKSNMGINETETAVEPESDAAFPSRYPYSEAGIVSTKYSQDHPYVSIETQDEGNIVAAGEGTITEIGSDADHPLIIEIEHGNGYRTRYMFVQDAEPLHEEGDNVQIGDVLAAVNAENEQVDYQVIFEDEPIDPLIVFEAKG